MGIRTFRGSPKSITSLLFGKNGAFCTPTDTRVAAPLPMLNIIVKKIFANWAVNVMMFKFSFPSFCYKNLGLGAPGWLRR